MKKLIVLFGFFAALSIQAQHVSDDSISTYINSNIIPNAANAITAAKMNHVLDLLSDSKLNKDSIAEIRWNGDTLFLIDKYNTPDTFILVSASDSSHFTRSGNYIFPENSTDSVGIGTGSPDEKLVVVGNFQLDDGATRFIQVGTSPTTQGNHLVIKSGAGTFDVTDASGNIYIYTPNDDTDGNVLLNVDESGTKTGGYVGVGVAVPGHPLDVDGTIRGNGSVIFSGLPQRDSANYVLGTDAETVARITFPVLNDRLKAAEYADSAFTALQNTDEYLGNLTVWYKDFINANKYRYQDNVPIDNASIVFIGDSEVQPFANNFKKILDDKFDYSGHGYVPMIEATYSESQATPWTLIGNSWTFDATHSDTLGLHGGYAENADNDSAILITKSYFNRLRFHYMQISGGGEFKWKVNYDGSLSSAISTDGATAGKMTVEIDAGADYTPDDTLYIYCSSGIVRLYGVVIYKEYVSGKQTYPIEVHRIFRGGSAFPDWNKQNAAAWNVLDSLAPSLIFVNFLENTMTINDSYRLMLDSLIATVKGVRDSTESNIIITSVQEGNSSTAFEQRPYITQVAEDRNVGHYDFYSRFGSYEVANALGILPTNHLYLEGIYISALKLFDLLIPNGYTEKADYYLEIPATVNADTGTIKQAGVVKLHFYGTENIFIGQNAGNYTMSGNYNVGIGRYCLSNNTTGTRNTALGRSSLLSVTDGNDMTAIGNLSQAYSTGSNNTSLGSSALYGVNGSTTGTANVAVGKDAAKTLTTAGYGVYVGYQAGGNATLTGDHNTVVGYQAGYGLTSGRRSVLIGASAGKVISTGQYNTIIGFNAGDAANSSSNVIIGYLAGTALTSGGTNTMIGESSGSTNTTGTGNVMLGYQSGANETGSNKLYIENSNSATPLIGGDFSANTLTVNGTVINPKGTIADNDVTPDVAGYNVFEYAGSANSVSIDAFDNHVVGAFYTIIGNSNTYTITIIDGTPAGGDSFNLNGSSWVGGNDDILVLYCISADNFLEISRSEN